MYVIGGQTSTSQYNNDVYRSSNGNSFSLQSTPPIAKRSYHSTLVYNDNLVVIGGNSTSGPLNDIWRTSNFNTWTQVTLENISAFAGRFNHKSIVHQNKI